MSGGNGFFRSTNFHNFLNFYFSLPNSSPSPFRTDSMLVKPRSYHSRAKSQCNTRSHNIDHEGAPAASLPNPTNIAKPITRGGNAR